MAVKLWTSRNSRGQGASCCPASTVCTAAKGSFLCRLQLERRQARPDVSATSQFQGMSHTLSQYSQIPYRPTLAFQSFLESASILPMKEKPLH